LHVGSARTALYAWLFARKHSGQFVLRIEDTDKTREVEGAIGHIMESLKWLGLQWDESTDTGGPYGPYIQSERLPIYRAYAERLLTAGHAYPDPYTEEDVGRLRKQAEEEKRAFLFREHRPETAQEWNGSAPLRFKVPNIKRYEWEDAVLGKLSAGEEALDDFVLLKSDGYPTYNFAHVVDDIEMRITHVMRGQEFVASTPKFLSLYDALGVESPVFATLPPILGESGTKKLSKRDGAQDVLDYRKEGYLPDAMLNFLALLGWHPKGNGEVFTREELIEDFSLERVQKSGAQFDEIKLKHLNREHLRKLSDDAFLLQAGLIVPDPSRLLRALPILRERAYTFKEAAGIVAGELAFVFVAPPLSAEQLTAKAPKQEQGGAEKTQSHLEAFINHITKLTEGDTPETIKAALMPYADAIPKEEGGRGAALWPLRYALSGAERSPDPFALIYILGREESLSRIRAALAILSV
jgi:glutamyl-tRNA synthetase